MRWVGIDEAGYGPNLGPLVMTAVVAEGPDERPPDVWGDLAATVARAGGDPDRLWIDDSKVLMSAGRGRDRLEAACRAAIAAAGSGALSSLSALLGALGAGSLDDVELSPWLESDDWPLSGVGAGLERALAGAPWRLVAVRSVVIGPARFNAGLAALDSKARVHFRAFAHLLAELWACAEDGVETVVRADKHGGRHFYLEPLVSAFPDVWIDRGPEGPELSRYTLRGAGRRLTLSLAPRADADDGLVALASIVSKAVREHWMDAFNAHWTARLPELRPTAGYPNDAQRFRQVIESECLARGFAPELWWRER